MLFVSHAFLNPHHPFSWFHWGSFSGTSECIRSTTTAIGETTCRIGWEGDMGGSGVGCCGCFFPLMNLWSHFLIWNPWVVSWKPMKSLNIWCFSEDVFHEVFFHLSKKQSSGVDFWVVGSLGKTWDRSHYSGNDFPRKLQQDPLNGPLNLSI